MTLEQLNICATFFGTLTALIIFCQWKIQKRLELLSNISHSTYRDLNNFFDDLNRYIDAHKYNLNYPENNEIFYGTEKELKPKVKDLCQKICTDLKLIEDETKDKILKSNFENFKRNIDSLFNMIDETLKRGQFSKDNLSFSLDDEGDQKLRYYRIDLDEEHHNVNSKINKLKQDLHSYIFYKARSKRCRRTAPHT